MESVFWEVQYEIPPTRSIWRDVVLAQSEQEARTKMTDKKPKAKILKIAVYPNGDSLAGRLNDAVN